MAPATQQRGVRALRPAGAAGFDRRPRTARRGQHQGQECRPASMTRRPTEVMMIERKPGRAVFEQLPFALTPGCDPCGTNRSCGVDRGAAAEDVRRGCRCCPTTRRGHSVSPSPEDPKRCAVAATGDDVEDVTAALLELDASYFAVHGPPGTGKTFRAAGSSATVVNEHGWRIRVVARSHAVVENLFRDVVGARHQPSAGGQEGEPAGPPWLDDRQGRLRSLSSRRTRDA